MNLLIGFVLLWLLDEYHKFKSVKNELQVDEIQYGGRDFIYVGTILKCIWCPSSSSYFFIYIFLLFLFIIFYVAEREYGYTCWVMSITLEPNQHLMGSELFFSLVWLANFVFRFHSTLLLYCLVLHNFLQGICCLSRSMDFRFFVLLVRLVWH